MGVVPRSLGASDTVNVFHLGSLTPGSLFSINFRGDLLRSSKANKTGTFREFRARPVAAVSNPLTRSEKTEMDVVGQASSEEADAFTGDREIPN